MNAVIAARTQAVRPDQVQGQQLRVVPILGPSHDSPPYRLLDEQTIKSVRVTEVSTGGSVPELKVQNDLEQMLFLMDGQELVGAKQNRILNTDVLVGAKGTLSIPVSCVEAHRWHYTSPQFSPGKAASHRVRSSKHERVYDSLKRDGRHDADQGAVWQDVNASLAASSTSSPTSSLHDAYDARHEELQKFRQSLTLPTEAVGVAVFRGGTLQGVDLFDRHTTLQYFWESLVDSYAIDSLDLSAAVASTVPEAEALQPVLARAAAGSWESFASPGEGREWRLDDATLSGSALVWQEQTVVHLQLFPKAPADGTPREAAVRKPRIHRPWMRPTGPASS